MLPLSVSDKAKLESIDRRITNLLIYKGTANWFKFEKQYEAVCAERSRLFEVKKESERKPLPEEVAARVVSELADLEPKRWQMREIYQKKEDVLLLFALTRDELTRTPNYVRLKEMLLRIFPEAKGYKNLDGTLQIFYQKNKLGIERVAQEIQEVFARELFIKIQLMISRISYAKIEDSNLDELVSYIKQLVPVARLLKGEATTISKRENAGEEYEKLADMRKNLLHEVGG